MLACCADKAVRSVCELHTCMYTHMYGVPTQVGSPATCGSLSTSVCERYYSAVCGRMWRLINNKTEP